MLHYRHTVDHIWRARARVCVCVCARARARSFFVLCALYLSSYTTYTQAIAAIENDDAERLAAVLPSRMMYHCDFGIW